MKMLMAFCGSACSLVRSIGSIGIRAGSPTIVPARENSLNKGNELNTILRDSRGYLWVGGWRPASIGTTSAAAGSRITPTIPMILTA